MSKKRIKIGFFIDELSIGGTEKQLVTLINNLPLNNFIPVLCVFRKHEFENKYEIKCKYYDLNYWGRGVKVLKNIFLIRKIYKILEKEKFDIVQTYFPEPEIHTILALRFLKQKPLCIGNRRNLNHWVDKSPFAFLLLKCLSRFNNYIFTNSYAAKRICIKNEGIDEFKVKVIHNSVDTKQYSKGSKSNLLEELCIASDDILVGTVGNWRAVKGMFTFIKAAGKAYKRDPKLKFVLAGHGKQKRDLIKLAKQLGIESRIQFLENYNDIPQLMSIFDIGVQPSYSESFSNVWIEYMATGLPIIATVVGDSNKVFTHTKNCLCIQPNQSDELSNAILELSGSKKKREQMGAAARETVRKNWAIDIIMKKYVNFYHTVLNDGTRQPTK